MVLAYSFGQVMWSMFVFFMWILWFWLLFTVFGDLFSRHDISGWAKAGWVVLVIVLPFLGVLLYLIANHEGMAERSAKEAHAQQDAVDAYIRETAGGSAAEIAKAKELLDRGAINQAEFDEIKRKALASA